MKFYSTIFFYIFLFGCSSNEPEFNVKLQFDNSDTVGKEFSKNLIDYFRFSSRFKIIDTKSNEKNKEYLIIDLISSDLNELKITETNNTVSRYEITFLWKTGYRLPYHLFGGMGIIHKDSKLIKKEVEKITNEFLLNALSAYYYYMSIEDDLYDRIEYR